MSKKGFTLLNAISVFDEDNEVLVFNSLEELSEYFDLSSEQLVQWKNNGETPWGGFNTIIDCYRAERPASTRRARSKKSDVVEVFRFRESFDGDHWVYNDGIFSSLSTIVQFIEQYLLDEKGMSGEAVQEICSKLKQDKYAKWVNPNDKKDKKYVHILSVPLDQPYFM